MSSFSQKQDSFVIEKQQLEIIGWTLEILSDYSFTLFGEKYANDTYRITLIGYKNAEKQMSLYIVRQFSPSVEDQ